MFARARGVKLDRILEATGVRWSQLLDPTARIPETTMPALWRLLAESFPEENLALQMASAVPLSVYGELTQLLRYSATIRELVDLHIRYSASLGTRLQISVHEGPEETVVSFSHPMATLDGDYGGEVSAGLSADCCGRSPGTMRSSG